VKKAFANAGAELLGIVPITDVEGRGAIPEVEIKYEKFGLKALAISENHLNLKRITQVAKPLGLTEFNSQAFVEKFKKSLMTE